MDAHRSVISKIRWISGSRARPLAALPRPPGLRVTVDAPDSRERARLRRPQWPEARRPRTASSRWCAPSRARLGGERAERAVAAAASLEREVGLGSLERVELLAPPRARLRPRPRRPRAWPSTPRPTGPRARRGAGRASRLRRPRSRAEPLGRRGRSRAAATVHESLWRRAELDPRASTSTCARRPREGRRRARRRSPTAACATRRRRWRAACASAASPRGDTVALMLPTGLDFLRTFQGILIAGGDPGADLPAGAPRPPRGVRRTGSPPSWPTPASGSSSRSARARPVASLLRAGGADAARSGHGATSSADGASWAAPEGRGSDPAFIQYTSGSTGAARRASCSPTTTCWPTSAPSGAGVEVPADRRRRELAAALPRHGPHRLLALLPPPRPPARPAVARSRSSPAPSAGCGRSTSGGPRSPPAPNFAYELCVRKIPDEALEGLDLSSWRCALNGAEPVSPEHPRPLRRAASLPTASGREAMMPVYGLAECSVAPVLPAGGTRPEGRPRGAGGPSRARARRGAGRRTTSRGARSSSPSGRALPGARGAHRGRRGRGRRRARLGRLVFRGPSMTRRLLPQARGHGRDHPARRLARQRRPRLPRRRARSSSRGGRKDLIIKARPQPRAAGDRGGGGDGATASAGAAWWRSA